MYPFFHPGIGRKPVTELQNISINQGLDEVENTASCYAIS